MKSIIAQEIERIGASSPTPFEVTFADGETYRNRAGAPAFVLRFRSRLAELGIAAFGHIGMCDAYFDGDLDVDGDLGAALRAGMAGGYDSPNALVEQRNRWHELRHSNASRERAKENARAHYGLGTPFYRLWLDDPLMMYTCAYWSAGTATLEQAQVNKIEHVCRKLLLREGETVIDIGCGFGGFMFHVAPRYGVHVTGTNTTTEQVAEVGNRIRRLGLDAQVAVVEADFREKQGPFDKVVSIGVLEHAGRDQLDEVVAAHADCLKPGGLGVLHFIGHVGRRDTEFFIRDHVFPGGWIPSLADVVVAMEAHGLEVLDVENLRRHYALTLDAWAERFDRRWDAIHALDPAQFDERFRRIWRTYLIACAEMFRSPSEQTHLFQIVFSKGNVAADGYPMTRDFLYAREAGPPE
ncbi:MAG: cyclopropane-fatty-acyl-phospholipid synthase family protein [Burkholderiales bacterium]